MKSASQKAVPAWQSPLPGARKAVFVSSDVYKKSAFGHHHPLSGPRIAAVLELCEILGWLPPADFHRSAPAGLTTLVRFHNEDYLAALVHADACGRVSREVRERYHIGTMENPLFSGLFERAASTVGGSVAAAELAMKGLNAFHPAGGTHHGRPDRASGFCYFNDPVFAILTFLDHGLDRILYLDLDAHHGDGVQDAFAADLRVRTVSLHEENRWPYSGAWQDHGLGSAWNLPVPRGFNDSELDYAMQTMVLPLVKEFAPEALVITCGADCLSGDPLSGMELSNTALWKAVLDVLPQAPRAVVLGGGGYNPWTVARCWTGLWGLLDGRSLPQKLPAAACELLNSFHCDLVDEEDIQPAWLNTLADDPHQAQVRPELVERIERVMEWSGSSSTHRNTEERRSYDLA